MPLGESGRVGALWLLRKRTQRVGVAGPCVHRSLSRSASSWPLGGSATHVSGCLCLCVAKFG